MRLRHGSLQVLLEKLKQGTKDQGMKRQELAPEIAEMYETPLTLEEFERRSATRPTEEEVAEFMSLVRWFTGRYPTAKDRFAYIRRKYAEWTRNPPAARR